MPDRTKTEVDLVISDHTIASALKVIAGCAGDKIQSASLGMTMAAVLCKVAGIGNDEALRLLSNALILADEYADEKMAHTKKAQH